MLLLNTSWGRSSLQGAEKYVATHPDLKIAGTNWFNWNDRTFVEKYQALRQSVPRRSSWWPTPMKPTSS